MPRFIRLDTVEAHQLRWDNWQVVADITGGRFVQGLSIEKSTGNATDGRAYMMLTRADRSGSRRAEVGWWIVKEGDDWIGMPEHLFLQMYAPANQIGA